MSSAPTLNSRLRVLVAKTFRAEKLYSSMRNSYSDKMGSPAALSQMANDIRAREWQRSHYQLRVCLNDLLAQGNTSALSEELMALRQRFIAKAEESMALLESGVQSLVENSRRQEFANIFKTSAELIRHKARAQASKVVADELTAVLEASGKKLPEQIERTIQAVERREPQPAAPSNVIPLPRRFAAGGRDAS